MSAESASRAHQAPSADREVIRQAVGLVVEPGAVVELRGERGKLILSGYFTDLDKLARIAANLSGSVEGCWASLNKVNPALLARADHRIIERPKHTTGDADIIRRRWIFIDIDPERPSGVSANDDEHTAALRLGEDIYQWARSELGCEPIFCDSGNGAHILIPIDLSNDDISHELIKKFLAAVDLQFSDSEVKVDTSTSNAGRLWKLPGTCACKGDSTPERPHRIACLLATAPWSPIPREKIEAVAAQAPKSAGATHNNGNHRGKVDVEQFLVESGHKVTKVAPFADGKKCILETCPWNSEHIDTAYVIQFGNGAMAAGCLAGSCRAAGHGWSDFPGRNAQRSENEGADGAADAGAYSDDALALDLVTLHGDRLRYVSPWGQWLINTPECWRRDERREVFESIYKLCRQAAVEGGKELPRGQRREFMNAIRSHAKASNIERHARAISKVAATVAQWDADRWALNAHGLFVALKPDEPERAIRAEDYMSKMTSVAPATSAEATTWQAYLKKVTNGDQELIAFLKRVFGYCLTGSTRERKMFFHHGTGHNGKTVFTNTMRMILGDYAVVIPMEMLMATRDHRHETEIAMLRGARLALATETEQGRRWAEAKIKALTGEEPLTGRFMRGDFFTFTPEFKLMITGNHKPALRGVDRALRGRILLIPWTVTIPEAQQNKNLTEELRAEHPAILRWAIEGCREWQEQGLNPPKVVLEATDRYLAEEDSIARWIEERCDLGPNYTSLTRDLHMNFREWAETNGEFAIKEKAFAEYLNDKFARWRDEKTDRRGFSGIRLSPEPPTGNEA